MSGRVEARPVEDSPADRPCRFVGRHDSSPARSARPRAAPEVDRAGRRPRARPASKATLIASFFRFSPCPCPSFRLLETRVLGVLVEKQHTVPDTYPLTLLALAAGCNQKTSREPVLSATRAAEVQAALDRSARHLSLVVEIERRPCHALRAQRRSACWRCHRRAVALIAVLMLRGPQTVGGTAHRTAIACTGSPTRPPSRASCTSSRRGPRARSRSNCRASPARAKRDGCISCPPRRQRDIAAPAGDAASRRSTATSASAKSPRSRPASRGSGRRRGSQGGGCTSLPRAGAAVPSLTAAWTVRAPILNRGDHHGHPGHAGNRKAALIAFSLKVLGAIVRVHRRPDADRLRIAGPRS